jgi:hypothetical protein
MRGLEITEAIPVARSLVVTAQDHANARRHRKGLVHRGFSDFQQGALIRRPKVNLPLARRTGWHHQRPLSIEPHS